MYRYVIGSIDGEFVGTCIRNGLSERVQMVAAAEKENRLTYAAIIAPTAQDALTMFGVNNDGMPCSMVCEGPIEVN